MSKNVMIDYDQNADKNLSKVAREDFVREDEKHKMCAFCGRWKEECKCP